MLKHAPMSSTGKLRSGAEMAHVETGIVSTLSVIYSVGYK
jgi:hypothetical protein